MNIIIKKLFGKYDHEIELQGRLNVLVGENGVGKTTVLRILNCLFHNDYITLIKYKFDSIQMIEDKIINTIKYDDLFPTVETLIEVISSLCSGKELELNSLLLKKLEERNLLKNYLIAIYFDSINNRELDYFLVKDKVCYDSSKQKEIIKEALNILRKRYSIYKIKKFSNKLNLKPINYDVEYVDFVEKYIIQNEMYKRGILVSSKYLNELNKTIKTMEEALKQVEDHERIEQIDEEEVEHYLSEVDEKARELAYEYDDEMYLDAYENEIDFDNFNEDDVDSDYYENSYDGGKEVEYLERAMEKLEEELEEIRIFEDENPFLRSEDLYTKKYREIIDNFNLYNEANCFECVKIRQSNIGKKFLKKLKTKRMANINELIAYSYYDKEFIKLEIEKIKTLLDEINKEQSKINEKLIREIEDDLEYGVHSTTLDEEEIPDFKTKFKISNEELLLFFTNQENVEKMLEYLIPFMPFGSPYEFFIRNIALIIKASSDITISSWYEHIFFIYNLIIDDLINYKNKKIQKLEELLNRYLSSKEIKIKPTGIIVYDKFYDFVEDKMIVNREKEISLNDLSAGEKKIVLLLTLATFYEKSGLMIDEPELSLSIIWQETLLKDLLNYTEVDRLIIATQSTYMVNDIELQSYITYLPTEVGEVYD